MPPGVRTPHFSHKSDHTHLLEINYGAYYMLEKFLLIPHRRSALASWSMQPPPNYINALALALALVSAISTIYFDPNPSLHQMKNHNPALALAPALVLVSTDLNQYPNPNPNPNPNLPQMTVQNPALALQPSC